MSSEVKGKPKTTNRIYKLQVSYVKVSIFPAESMDKFWMKINVSRRQKN